MENSVKNREWVKTAAIIFLAVLLVLTFFSNTIMNRTLPEVATVEVTSGPITAKVRGTGKVTAVGNTEVKANGTRTIAQVKAKEGAEVKAGDILFVMGAGDSEELSAAQDNLESLKFQLLRQQIGTSSGNEGTVAALEAAERALTDAKQEVEDAKYSLSLFGSNDSDALKAAQQELAEAISEKEAAQQNLDSKRAALNDALTIAKNDYAAKALVYDNDSTPENETAMLDAKAVMDQKQQEYDVTLLENYPLVILLRTAEANSAAAQSKVDSLTNESSVYTARYQSALTALATAETAYNSAYSAAAAAAASSNQSAATNWIDQQETQAKIAKAQKKVDELSGTSGTEITAPIAGTIQSISCSPGDKIQKDQVLCVIEVPDMGYRMSYSVTNEQARRLKVGDTASVSNYYWGNDITATISSIKIDPKDPQAKKLVTFDLEGNVTNGADLTVSVGQKSAEYDSIVPNSSVRTDSNGSFVLKINAKNSPLGNRYFAQRVDVEVLASDDVNSAVNAELGYGDFVITTSSSPIKNGTQVRMADNG